MVRCIKVGASIALLFALASCSNVQDAAMSKLKIYTIPGISMEPLLKPGQKVQVEYTTKYKPHRGDVVLFQLPEEWLPGGDKALLRVVGLPGENVACCDTEGRVTINGKVLDEPYVLQDGSPSMAPPYDVKVPPGTLWLLGDNRNAAPDSRVHAKDPDGGFVPASNVVGVYAPR